MYYLEGECRIAVPEIKVGSTGRTEKFLIAEFSEESNRTVQMAGIAQQFSRLKTESDILNFANQYGLLGVDLKNITADMSTIGVSDFEYVGPKHAMEPIDIWQWHINHVYGLFKLYHAIKNEGNIDGVIALDPDDLRSNATKYKITWSHSRGKGKQVVLPPLPPGLDLNKLIDSAPSQEDLGRFIASCLLSVDTAVMLNDVITVDFLAGENNRNYPLGYRFVERKATKYLLAAIYYDLWKTVNDPYNEIKICEICENPFTAKHRDTKFCGKACQKRNQRRIASLTANS